MMKTPGVDLRRNELRAYGLALVATAMWAGNYVLARGLNDQIGPVALASWRWILAIVLLLPFAYRTLLEDLAALRRHAGYVVASAILGVTLLNTLVYIAGRTTSTVNMSLIMVSSPIFTILMAVAAGQEEIDWQRAIGATVAATGVVLLLSHGSIETLLTLRFVPGDLLVIGAAVSFAGYTILVRRKPTDLHNRSFLLSTFIVGWLFLLPFHIWERYSSGPWIPNLATISGVVYLALFASLLAYFAWNKAVESVGPATPAVIYYAMPIFSGIEGAVLLGEKLTALHLVSFVLIVGGIILGGRASKRLRQEDGS